MSKWGDVIMSIHKVSIKRFTVFCDFEMELCKGINLIIGDNGVGKTHLLKIIYSLSKPQHDYTGRKVVSEPGQSSLPAAQSIGLSSVFDVGKECSPTAISEAGCLLHYDLVPYSVPSHLPRAVFIPAKEMLSHAKGLLSMKSKYGENMPFDSTLLDIIEKAQAWKLTQPPPVAEIIAPALEKIIGGVVEVKDDGSFWVNKIDGAVIPFSMEAEGYKQFGLLWQLLMNESITRNSLLLWDEPENSINPEHIPVLVESLLELQRNGVQVVAATHSYNFVRYFDILRTDNDSVRHFCLYKEDGKNTLYSSADSFLDLFPNPVDNAGERLYKDAIRKVAEES